MEVGLWVEAEQSSKKLNVSNPFLPSFDRLTDFNKLVYQKLQIFSSFAS